MEGANKQFHLKQIHYDAYEKNMNISYFRYYIP